MKKTIIVLICVIGFVTADENLTFDARKFLDTVVKVPRFLQEEIASTKSFAKNNDTSSKRRKKERFSLPKQIVRKTVNNRNVQKIVNTQDVFVVGSHLGRDITTLLQRNFREAFSQQQVASLQQQIKRTIQRTTRSFHNSAFFIDVKSAELKAFVKADDFAGKAGKSFSRSDLLGKTIAVGDENFTVVAAKNFSPIVFDLDGNGKIDTSHNEWLPHAPKFFTERTALFDISGDGKVDLMEWIGKNDGLLVLPEIDGRVEGGRNLFGTAGGFCDGYAKMAIVLDTDNNGWIEKEELQGLFLWRDRNGDAKAQSQEMICVIEYGVEKINVQHKNFTSFSYINGKKVTTWDWWPAAFELEKLSDQTK